MREVYGKITQLGGALLAVALVLALGVSLNQQQERKAPTTAAVSTLQVRLPAALEALSREQNLPYTITGRRDQSLLGRPRLLVHVVTPVNTSQEWERVAAKVAAALAKENSHLQAIAVLVFTSVEAERHGESLACARLIYAPDGRGWDGNTAGQPAARYESLTP